MIALAKDVLMRIFQARAPLLLLLAGLLASGCSGLRSGDDAVAADVYTRKRLDQLKSSGVKPAAFEDETAESQPGLKELPGKLTESIQKATGTAADSELARSLYGEGEVLFRKASQAQGSERAAGFVEAARKYQAAARKWPDSALEEDARFMVGECYFFADEYPEANEAFELLLKDYPHTRHLDRTEARRFAIAQYWLQQYEEQQLGSLSLNMTDKTRPAFDTFAHALRVLNKIRLDDPTGKLADDATLAAGNAQFKAGRFIEADEFFTDLRKAYPTSEHQFVAHLLSVKAKLESYQGPDYSGDVLDQAEELIKQIRRQFPTEAEKEREFLARAYGEIRHQKAEREWWMGRYYDRRYQYRAARQHYQKILDEYADTAYQEQAAERVAALAGKPPRPPERLTWLIDLFPRNEEVKPLLGTDGGPTVRR